MDPNTPRPFREYALIHGYDPDWLLAYAQRHLASPPEDISAKVDHATVIHPLITQLRPNAIAAIHVANFKAFGPTPQRFPLAPITLVFGPNSAGKSSLMQALLYAQHSLLEGELDVTRPRGSGALVDLGGFAQCIHRHAENQNLIFGFEFAHHWRKLGPDAKPAIWWVTIGTRKDSTNPVVLSATLEVEGKTLLSTGGHNSNYLSDGTHRLQFGCYHPLFYKIINEFGQWCLGYAEWQLADDENLDYGYLIGRTTDDLEKLNVFIALDGLKPSGCSYANVSQSHSEVFNWDEQTKNSRIKQDYAEFLGEILSVMDHAVRVVGEAIDPFLREISYISSARVLPGRDYENLNTRDLNFPHNGGSAWDRLRSPEGTIVRQRLNRWFSDLARREKEEKKQGLAQYRFETSYDLNRNLVEGIIETEAQNYLMEKHEAHERARADSERDESFYFPFDQLDATDLKDRILKSIAEQRNATTNHRLQIIDARVGHPVTPADIGVGIQYLIPVLVEIYGGEKTTKIIEEPELHAHPALQAELGDALIEGALHTATGNRFIVETHSEHLILRILRRVREAYENSDADPASLPKVRPEDIAVVYAEPSAEGTILHHLKISGDGDFVDRWPSGFFTERADELF
jgi:hypothetical protein